MTRRFNSWFQYAVTKLKMLTQLSMVNSGLKLNVQMELT